MLHKKIFLLGFVVGVLTVSACTPTLTSIDEHLENQSPAPAPAFTASTVTTLTPLTVTIQSMTFTPTPTVTIEPSAIRTSWPTFDPTMSTPTVSNSQGYELLREALHSTDCEPACWQALTIGQSTLDDVYSVLDTQLGFEGNRNFHPLLGSGEIPGIAYAISHYWLYDPNSELPGIFELIIWLNSDDNKLAGVELYFESSTDFAPGLSTLEILESAGEPEKILVDFSQDQGPQDIGVLEIIVVYSDGLLVSFGDSVTVESGLEQDRIEYCLDNEISAGHIYITEPISGLDLGSLTALQKGIYGPRGHFARYVSAERFFGFTPEQIMEIILEGETPCLIAFRD